MSALAVYTYKVSISNHVDLFRNGQRVVPNALFIKEYKDMLIIERCTPLRWTQMEFDAVLIKLLKEIHGKMMSTITIIDRGDTQLPLYRLTVQKHERMKLYSFINEAHINFKLDHETRKWYIDSFTLETDAISIPFTETDNGFIAKHKELVVDLKIDDTLNVIAAEFTYNTPGKLLKYHNIVDRYAHNLYWHLHIRYENNVVIHSACDIIIVLMKVHDHEKQLKCLYKLIKRFPLLV